jgi:hypothetical protein
MSLAASTVRAIRARKLALSLSAFWVLLMSALLVHAPGVLFNVGVRNLDFNAHYFWAIQFAEGMRDGDPYPHWMWSGNFGFGEVALLFYSPLFYYTSGIVRLLTANTWGAMRIVFVLSTILTGLYGWRVLRLFTGNVYALIGAVLMQWVPMIFMLFYYFNGFPWAVGFAALVALIYYTVRPGAFERWVDVPVSLAVATLTLTHLVSALMTLVCFSFMWLCGIRCRQEGWTAARRAVSWFISAASGLALSMFYLFPALAERRLISAEVWTTNFTPWNAFAFPTITSLAFGLRWFTFQWTVPAIVLFGVAVSTWQISRRLDAANHLGEVLLRMVVISWAALFFASELSYPLWLIDTPLRIVQFPHRFIYVASATGLVANLLSLRDLQRIRQTRWRKLLVALPLVLGLAATGVLSAKLSFIDGKPHHLSVDATIPYLGLPEYRLGTQGEHWETFYRAGGFTVECLEKELTCDTIKTTSSLQAWQVSSAHPINLRLPLFAFPAWQVTIDGMPVQSASDPETGLISIDLPVGTHHIVASWTRLGAERVGLGITALAALVLVLFAFTRRSQIFTR